MAYWLGMLVPMRIFVDLTQKVNGLLARDSVHKALETLSSFMFLDS